MRAALRIPGELGFAESPIPDPCLCSAARMLSRYVSRPLERLLAGHGITITEFQLMVALQEGPARALHLARRLRLDPGPTGRALARLAERGVVRRALPWRFTEWILEHEGAMHLELLEPAWVDVNRTLHDALGSELPKSLVRVVDHLWYPVPREHQGWSD
ncbi:MAG: MarR family transcriptional regulator [Myxococcaceae bacterium]|nr:MAG: MarR family transcriptional regulator [Myxococcaceae bacterium]